MNPKQLAQYAALCVEELDAHSGSPLSVQEISLRKGIPLTECTLVVNSLVRAGIVERVNAGHAVVLLRDVTALELLQAVWTKKSTSKAFQMLHGGHHGKKMQTTRSFVMCATNSGKEAING